MAKSVEDICNLALLRAGQLQTIDSLTEDTEQARACNILFPHHRDALLERFNWPWATRSATLALLANPDGSALTRPGWVNAYQLPGDCLKPRYIFAGARPTALAPASVYPSIIGPLTTVATIPTFIGEVPEVPFTVEANDAGTGQILLCDLDNAQLVYTVALTVATVFPQPFIEALAWALAADLSLSLTKKPAVAQGLGQRAELEAHRAFATALNAQGADPRPDSEFVSARR